MNNAVKILKMLADVGLLLDARRSWKVQERRQALVRSVLDAVELPPVEPRHLALIELLRVTWHTVESGAPSVRCFAPFGRHVRTVAAGMAALGSKDESLFVRTMVEVARLIPSYVAHNAQRMVGVHQIPSDMRAYFGDPDSGMRADGTFEFRDDHAKLLLHANWRIEDEIYRHGIKRANPDWPMPSIDGKRPYGDRSYYQLDMAHHLGKPYPVTDDGEPQSDPDLDASMSRLHFEMLAALQVVLSHGAHP